MKLFKIGNDFYNLDFLLKVEVNQNDSVTLSFSDRTERAATSVTITKENWKTMARQIKADIIGSTDNEYDRQYIEPTSA